MGRGLRLSFLASHSHTLYSVVGFAALVRSGKALLPGSPLRAWVSLPPAPSGPAPSSWLASSSPLPVCSASLRLGPHPSTAHRPAARKAADTQQAALGEPPESARAARLGEEGAGAAPAVPAGAAERGVGEVGRHHPAGGPGHHRPPDRGLSGRAAATHRATDEGRCSARSCRRTGTDTLVGSGRGPRPGLRALGRRPGRGPQCWDQSQTGQETAAPVGTGLQRPKVPQTLPSSGPALVDGQTAADNGQAGCGQRPQGCPPELLQQRTSLLGPAGLAPFFRHPHPSEAASPPPTTPSRAWVPLPRPRRRAQPSPLRHPGPGAEAHSGKKQGWGIYFFSPFLFFNKKN